jgi:S1-C subfamily serine protease
MRLKRPCAPGTALQIILSAFVALGAWLQCADAEQAQSKPASSQIGRLYQQCQAAGFEVLLDGRHSGSGWFAQRDGLAVTAGHLFDRRDPRVELLRRGNERVGATLVAIDRGHDIAVLRATARPGGYPTLPLARKRPGLGDEVLQFGAPLFRSETLQPGKVARAETLFEYYGEAIGYVEVLHVAAMMQGGTSGGPWLNAKGEVVGLQSGMMSLDSKPVGIAYLVPCDFIRAMLDSLRDGVTPTLGLAVDELWQQSQEFLQKLPPDTTGLVIAKVRKDGPADRAGIKTTEIIVAADQRKVVRIHELLRLVRGKKPGEGVTLKIFSPGSSGAREQRVELATVEADLVPRSNQK